MEKLNTDISKWLFCGWLIIVLTTNVIPLGNDINKIIHKPVFKFRLDYLIHFCSFLIFIPLYFIEVRRGGPFFSKKPVLKYMLIVGSSAILFESIQYFLPYRTFNPMDLISNLTGTIIGTIIISFFIPSLKSKQATTGN
jgi:VanZ family protein